VEYLFDYFDSTKRKNSDLFLNHTHYILSIATNDMTEYGVPESLMEQFIAERQRLERNKHFREARSLGLVKHVTEMGTNTVELHERCTRYGNCANCKWVGMIYERCPHCNTDINRPPFFLFLPFWTKSHCYVNPRLISKAFGNTTMPYTVQEQFQVRAQVIRFFFAEDAETYKAHMVLDPEAINVIFRNRMRARGDTEESSLERLIRWLSYEQWKGVCRHYNANLVAIGDQNELFDIEFIQHQA